MSATVLAFPKTRPAEPFRTAQAAWIWCMGVLVARADGAGPEDGGMTPERQAAECIARAVATNPKEECVHFRSSSGECARRAFPCTCAEDGRRGVEAMADAGLVLMTAQRAAELLEVERAARALAESEEKMAAELRGEDTAEAFDPWPEADALVKALRREMA